MLPTKSIQILSAALDNSSKTDSNVTVFDFGDNTTVKEFIVSAKVTEGSTAPGAAKTITANIYWSDEQISPTSDVPTILAGRKTALTAFTRANSANAVRQAEVLSTITRPRARYAYFTVDQLASDASSVATLALNLIRLGSTADTF